MLYALLSYIGTCEAAGITECCEGDSCLGDPADCYCDQDCFFFSDCCQDIQDVCQYGEHLWWRKRVCYWLYSWLVYPLHSHNSFLLLSYIYVLPILHILQDPPPGKPKGIQHTDHKWLAIDSLSIFPSDTDYLLFASHTTINHIDFNGDNFNILLGPLSGGVFGLDFHFRLD